MGRPKVVCMEPVSRTRPVGFKTKVTYDALVTAADSDGATSVRLPMGYFPAGSFVRITVQRVKRLEKK